MNPDGTNATAITNRVRFCEDVTRTSPVAGPRCLACDLSAMAKASETHEPSILEYARGDAPHHR